MTQKRHIPYYLFMYMQRSNLNQWRTHSETLFIRVKCGVRVKGRCTGTCTVRRAFRSCVSESDTVHSSQQTMKNIISKSFINLTVASKQLICIYFIINLLKCICIHTVLRWIIKYESINTIYSKSVYGKYSMYLKIKKTYFMRILLQIFIHNKTQLNS